MHDKACHWLQWHLDVSTTRTGQVAEGDEDEDGGEDHEDEVQLDALGLRQRQRVVPRHYPRACTAHQYAYSTESFSFVCMTLSGWLFRVYVRGAGGDSGQASRASRRRVILLTAALKGTDKLGQPGCG